MNTPYMKLKVISSAIFLLLLSSCTDDGDIPKFKKPNEIKEIPNTSVNTDDISISIDINGVLVDGYIKDATVCLDVDKNDGCSSDEPLVKTDGKGVFSLTAKLKGGSSYVLIGTGGIDTATNEAFNGTYKTIIAFKKNTTIESNPTYSVNLTPLSTIISNIYNTNIKTNSNYEIKTAVDLVSKSMDLSSSQVSSDPLKSIKVFEKTQIIVHTAQILSSNIKESDTPANTKKAFNFVMESLSASISKNKHQGNLEVAPLIAQLDESSFNSKKIKISLNVESLATKNIKYISDKISEVNVSNANVSVLVSIQKITQMQTNKISSDVGPNNKVSGLSAPTLTTTPSSTSKEFVKVEVNGKEDTILIVNNVESGKLVSGKISIDLNTSGVDGAKDFNLTLKDGDDYSASLIFKITKNTTPPTATMNDLVTDDTTPALSGGLSAGVLLQHIIQVRINNVTYKATSNGSTWSIADNVISELAIGSYDVNITITDEDKKSNSTVLTNKILIDNSGFLIDSAIEGIKYISGSYNGWTDVNGLFKYDKSAGVTFYIGDESTGIPLGKASPKTDPHNDKRKIVTLFDLAGSSDEDNNKVLNMGTLLQSLDADGDISNGITIDARTKESITLLALKNRIDFSMGVEAFRNHNDIYDLFNDLADHFGEHRGLKETNDVKAHLVAVRDNVQIVRTIGTKKVKRKKVELKILDGVFKSSTGVVQGLEYRSGNQFGRTDDNGTFKYEEGKKIKFYIYQLELGITRTKPIITPADLIPATSFNHPKPRNIIRLLKAFDSTSEATVVIDNAVREALEKYRSQIDINLPDGKANEKLGIPKGEDEFGAQFEEFEMGKDILDEIDKLRGGS